MTKRKKLIEERKQEYEQYRQVLQNIAMDEGEPGASRIEAIRAILMFDKGLQWDNPYIQGLNMTGKA